MKKLVVINDDLIELIEAIKDIENENSQFEKSFSRVLNYLLVLGIDKYAEIYNVLELKNFAIMHSFDFDKRMGSNDYKVSYQNDIERKRKRLKEKLASLGRSFFEE